MPRRQSRIPAALLALALAACTRGIPLLPAQSPPSAQGGLHEVVATGSGTSPAEALKAAFTAALERTVGAIVHSQTVSRNFQIESDVQTLLTNGCIDSYDEISSSETGGIFQKTIRARVRRGMVADWMGRAGWAGDADLGDTWARLATTIRGRKQALAMLHEKVPQIRDTLYRASLVDLATGANTAAASRVPPPFTEENLDGGVVCVWAAAVEPDFAFWETHAAPLLAACFDALCESKGRLFLNMEPGPSPAPGMFPRMPATRWRRFEPGHTPPWENAAPVTRPAHAPHCIALETRTTHPDCLDLTLYFFTDEVFQRIVSPPEIRDAEGNLKSRPERFGSLRMGTRATLEFDDGSSRTFSVIQPSPLFMPVRLPWTGGASAAYCGPYLFRGIFSDGWQKKSIWPDWHGPVLPEATTPGFAPFLIDRGRIMRSDGPAFDKLRSSAENARRTGFQTAPFDWETLDHTLFPVVFKLQVDELPRVRRLRIEPVTGAPPPAPGLGEALGRLLKNLLGE